MINVAPFKQMIVLEHISDFGGFNRPEIRDKMVDLPQPLGPTKATNAPFST